MANTKGQGIRQREIDKCLKSERGYSTAELMEKCNNELRVRGYEEVTSRNTITSDLDEITTVYCVEIEKIRIGRNIRYRYEDRNFSIYKTPLTDGQKEQLKEIIESISIYEGRPQSEWLSGFTEEMKSILEIDSCDREKVVGFDNNEKLVGLEHFKPLIDSIRHRKAVSVKYRSFNSPEVEQVVFHPYYLKQYNNRWFIFGEKNDRTDLTNYALDRIVTLSESDVLYRPNNGKYDFSTYFDDMVGVSRKDGKPVTVRLWISAFRYPYIKTKPIHKSQKEIKLNEDRSAEIELNVILNLELESRLLYYGPELKVLEPDALKNRIKKKIEENLKNYL